jgi:hypothetical protein
MAHSFRHILLSLRWIALTAFLLIVSASHSAAKEKFSGPSVVRWNKASSNSTFSSTADGKYIYVLKDGDIEISIAMDSQELEKVHHRPLPLFAVRMDVRYTGQKSLQFTTDHIALEFADHYQVINRALDPDELATRIQNDIDSLTDETAHQVRKRPDQKEKQESALQTHLKDMTDLVGFISLYCLRPATLDSGNPTAGGWVFFSTRSKWIGKWKPQEEFVLQVPVENKIFEFPFALPPRKGDLLLRRRED